MLKPTETFADFYTCFLHLAGQAKIPNDDLRLDLFDKLTIELQRTVLSIYSTPTTVKNLLDECLSLDQGLCRLKARLERIKSCNTLSAALPTKASSTSSNTYNTPATLPRTLSRESTPAASRTATPKRTRLSKYYMTVLPCIWVPKPS